MRLDVALVARGVVSSRNRAARLIQSGRVRVDGVVLTKPSAAVDDHHAIEAELEPWVSRAAHKLLGALEDSGITMPARVLDAGASTGGFTQVCLERGAETVYAVDVGHDQLVPSLREDPRVRLREGLNLRALTLAHLDGEPVDLVVGDVSFISLSLLLGPLLAVCRGEALLLVKPQFEVGRHRLGPGGIVTDPSAREDAVAGVLDRASALGWTCRWQGESRLPGTHGNFETFVALRPKQRESS